MTTKLRARLTKKNFLIFCIFCLFVTARGQYRFDQFTADNGLPQNSVLSVAQSAEGYLWFTTLDGLVRFDGVRFKIFNKSNSPEIKFNRLKYLTFAKDGTLWISTENAGLIRFREGRFKTFTVDDGLISNDVNEIIEESDGGLLIVTFDGINRTRDNGASFTLERRQNFREYKLYAAPSGIVWEVNAEGIFAWRGGAAVKQFELPFTPSPTAYGEPFNFSVQTALFEDRAGALRLAAGGKLFKLQNGEVSVLTADDGMPQSLVFKISGDEQNRLWLATEGDGACRLIGDRFDCFNAARGLSSDNVRDIFFDREKTLWVATTTSGIVRATPQPIKSFSRTEGLADDNVYPILEDRDGNIWIGAFSALTKYAADGKVSNLTKNKDLIYEIVQTLFEDRDGTLWVGSVGGVQFLKNGTAVDFTRKLGLEIGKYDFWDIHQTPDGALWFATLRGLFRYENGVTTSFSTENGLPADDVKVIHEARDGSLWIGTAGGIAQIKDGKVKVFTEREGLAGNFTRSIYEDEAGYLWFGTYDSGLTLLRDGKFTKITADDGLFSNGVFQILPDSRGNFWMSSNQGIYRVSRAQLLEFADGKRASVFSTAFGKSDGMLNAECNGGRQPAGIRARSGKLWFPTQNGAAIVDPEAVAFNPFPPPVIIENVAVENKTAEGFPSAVSDRQTAIVVEAGQNNLQIDYTGVSFIKPEQVRFRYRLEGLDTDWTEAGGRRTAFYPYLPPGEYVFRVIAANSDNVWNEQGASVKIKVEPPFYRTWFFIGGVLTAVGIIAFVFYRTRISRLERARRMQEDFSRRLISAHETERRRIAAELHDSIGQSLAMIKNSAVFGAQTVNDLGEAKEHLAEISTQSVQAISEVREIAYNLRPYLLDRLGLTKAIRALLEKIEDNSALEIDARIEDIDGVFEPETEISLYRIIQESLNNVLKHAEASKINISVINGDGGISIKIRDDGKGFDVKAQNETKRRGGFGLLGMHERVRLLDGSMTIESKSGEGTKIEIKLWKRKLES